MICFSSIVFVLYCTVLMEYLLDLSIFDSVDFTGKNFSFITPGDHPELEFEAGNSIGGTFPCECGCDSERFGDTTYVFKTSSIQSLEDRRKKV